MSHKKIGYSDGGWPELAHDEHAVTELLADKQGPLSPYGDVDFPVPAEQLPYVHPKTYVNF